MGGGVIWLNICKGSMITQGLETTDLHIECCIQTTVPFKRKKSANLQNYVRRIRS